MVCGMAQDLKMMEFKEDVFEIPTLKPMYNESLCPKPCQRKLHSWESPKMAGGSAEQALRPEDATGLEEITTGSHALLWCPLLPPAFEALPSACGPPPFEGIA